MREISWEAAGLLLVLVALNGCGATDPTGMGQDPEAAGPAPLLPQAIDGMPFQRGMVYGIFGRSGRRFHRANLEALEALGVDSIEIVIPRAMDTIHSTELTDTDPWVTPSRESLEQAVDEAHRLGMRVLLLPILFIQHLSGEEWRGSLEPADWDRWWENYDAFIVDEAAWAARQNVEMFSVGSELCSTERFTDRWAELIGRVREVFGGRVTYSANWDHLEQLGFASLTDFVGMNAYHEVGKNGTDVAALVAAWDVILPRVEAWQQRVRRPLVVTEVGYQSRHGTTRAPWDYLGEGAPDPAEQDRAYRAFIEAWSRVPGLAGTYFYIWWDEDDGGRGYTPRGKPAAETLKRWYNQ
ncbi:MAG: hypothetical protein ACE5IK_12255 [Acidobacteriota bacterium]